MLSGVQLFAALWAVVCQAPLPRGFSRWSSQSRDLTHISFVSYLVKWIFYHWATRDTPIKNSINTKKNERKWALPSKFHSFQLISSLFLLGQYVDPENLFYWKWPLLLLSRFSRVRLCDPIDGSPPGSPIPRILQARTLEWVSISFSNSWKWKVKVKSLSCVRLFSTPWTAAF